ncbi:MAG: hypothetical protein AAF493_18035 [Pseudomonadota bacterium]
MLKGLLAHIALALGLSLAPVQANGPTTEEILGAAALAKTTPVSIVRHRWQVKIVESNQVAIRPGSVYDIVTYFEQNLGFPKPRFNYLFLDTGLGTADPIYPVFQRGRQAGWHQLLPAMWSEKNRHIDHASVIDTPEGCRIHSTYWVRHIDEFPDRWAAERDEGYTLVDISFNYYTKLRPDAQCGRHRAHTPDPSFDPQTFVAQFSDGFHALTDVPVAMLNQFEAKIGLLKMVSEEFDREKWPRFKDVYAFEKNSLWYYPEGVTPDFGLNVPQPQPGLDHLALPAHLQIDAAELPAEMRPLRRYLKPDEFAKLMDFLDGQPIPNFDPSDEPGNDLFALTQVGPQNYYTSGLHRLPISNVRETVSNPDNFRLVSVILRPYQRVDGLGLAAEHVIPQVRFVFQLVDPKTNAELEQLFLHLNFDAIDRFAMGAQRAEQYRAFLAALDRATATRESQHSSPTVLQAALGDFIGTYTQRPVSRLSFSSALTGIWAFGTLSRAYNPEHSLEAVRIVREGVDVGYYSTAYDTVLFREAAAAADETRREQLNAHLDALTPRDYRDPRRSDPTLLTFERMTCAQCHHMAGRDAVHVAHNDGLDRRFTAPTRTTEFLYREFLRQLIDGPTTLGTTVARHHQ